MGGGTGDGWGIGTTGEHPAIKTGRDRLRQALHDAWQSGFREGREVGAWPEYDGEDTEGETDCVNRLMRDLEGR